jgi:hypothetical protein
LQRLVNGVGANNAKFDHLHIFKKEKAGLHCFVFRLLLSGLQILNGFCHGVK